MTLNDHNGRNFFNLDNSEFVSNLNNNFTHLDAQLR